jgi:hypothetical protein
VTPLARSALILLIIVVLTAVMMFFLRDDTPCPDGQVPALSNDRWVCVQQGG